MQPDQNNNGGYINNAPDARPLPSRDYSGRYAAGEGAYTQSTAGTNTAAQYTGRRAARHRKKSKLTGSGKAVIAAAVLLIAAILVSLLIPEKERFGTVPAGKELLRGYGRGYSSYVFRYGSESGLPYGYIAAIIKNESSYDKNAVSRVGARGLMQLMPAAAKDAAKRVGLKDFSEDMLFDAGTNIRLGCSHLSWLSRYYFGDDLLLIICAYHAGQGNVQSWVKKYSSDGKTLTIDQIPMQDTRSYARKVMNDYAVYTNRIYNLLYENEIRAYSVACGVPSALTAAVIMYSSAYDAGMAAHNTSRGASGSDPFTADRYGLMQVTLLQTETDQKQDASQLLQPDLNISTGCRVLGELLSRYGGDRDRALCAYWAGTEMCDQWIREAEKAGRVFSAESIPDVNTRDFVKGVKEGYDFYRPYYQD